MSHAEQVAHLRARLGWTHCQARVVLAGVKYSTYREIGLSLQMRERTVRAHFRGAMEKASLRNRATVTALAVAVLWQLKELPS